MGPAAARIEEIEPSLAPFPRARQAGPLVLVVKRMMMSRASGPTRFPSSPSPDGRTSPIPSRPTAAIHPGPRSGRRGTPVPLAVYVAGPAPKPSMNDLLEMVTSFAESRGLGTPSEVALEGGPLCLAAGSFTWGEDFLRVWQVSDGRNFAFVTYTGESGQEQRELDECERIVRSLQFRGSSRD